MCCWQQCCFRAHTAMPGVFFINLGKSRKSSPTSHWECKWGWSFCSTTRDKHAPGDIIHLTSKMTAEAEQEQQLPQGRWLPWEWSGKGESILLHMARRKFQSGQTAPDSQYYSSSGEEMTLGTKTKAQRNRMPGRLRRAQGNTKERKELSRRMLSVEQYRSP